MELLHLRGYLVFILFSALEWLTISARAGGYWYRFIHRPRHYGNSAVWWLWLFINSVQPSNAVLFSFLSIDKEYKKLESTIINQFPNCCLNEWDCFNWDHSNCVMSADTNIGPDLCLFHEINIFVSAYNDGTIWKKTSRLLYAIRTNIDGWSGTGCYFSCMRYETLSWSAVSFNDEILR